MRLQSCALREVCSHREPHHQRVYGLAAGGDGELRAWRARGGELRAWRAKGAWGRAWWREGCDALRKWPFKDVGSKDVGL